MNKNILFVVIGIVIVTSISVFLLSNKKTDSAKNTTVKSNIDESEEVFMPLDKNIKVNGEIILGKRGGGGKDFTFFVSNIPSDIDYLEYKLTYERQAIKGRDEGAEGTIVDGSYGKVEKKDFVNNGFNKLLTIGSESSGKYTNHTIVGKASLIIKFVNASGQQKFEEEY
jgi:hypothetical protein